MPSYSARRGAQQPHAMSHLSPQKMTLEIFLRPCVTVRSFEVNRFLPPSALWRPCFAQGGEPARVVPLQKVLLRHLRLQLGRQPLQVADLRTKVAQRRATSTDKDSK